jgi:hypothetical protein
MPGNMPPLRPQPEPRVSRTVDSTEPPPPLRLYIEVESQNPPSASASQAFLHRDQQTMLKLVKNIQKTVDELAHDVGDMKRAHEASHALLVYVLRKLSSKVNYY